MGNYLKLVRWPNLLMISVFQYLMRYALVAPILDYQEKGLIVSHLDFALLVLSCVFIAAGGYIINDIEDVKIDSINKESRVLINAKINADSANNLYMVLSFLGVAIGFYLTFVKEIKLIGMINLITAGLLYFYSTSYKCIPVLGNIIIALLTALLPLLVVLPEPAAMNDQAVLSFTGGYIIFAFLMTLIRELIKDLEDKKGDAECGCKTLPVVVGNFAVKIITFLLIVVVIVLLILIQIATKQWESIIPFLYVSLFIVLPLLYLCMLIIKSNVKDQFKKASVLTKLVMFTGILSMLVFYFSTQ
jgi:4-hydroxybenzoate polyprenyltransferase